MPPGKKKTQNVKPPGIITPKPEQKEKPEKKGKSKKNKKGKKGKKKKKIVNWADDEHFDPSRVIIHIEHTEECPIFKQKATEFHKLCESVFTNREIVLLRNEEITPRDGAFEIYVAQNAKLPKELIWSGVDKGPPRRDKFPVNFEDILPEVEAVLNKMYMDPNEVKEDDDPAALLEVAAPNQSEAQPDEEKKQEDANKGENKQEDVKKDVKKQENKQEEAKKEENKQKDAKKEEESKRQVGGAEVKRTKKRSVTKVKSLKGLRPRKNEMPGILKSNFILKFTPSVKVNPTKSAIRKISIHPHEGDKKLKLIFDSTGNLRNQIS